MRIALVITAGRYADLPRLHAPRHDGGQLAEVLADPEVGDFRVEVLADRKVDRVRRRVNEVLADAGPDDVVLLYFSGHGVKDVSGELYLAAVDTRRDLLPATGLSARFVRELVDRCRARQVLVWLDCCFGGAFPQGASPKAGGDVDVVDQVQPARGCAVMAASTAIEYAYERGGEVRGGPRGSYFTRALVAGLATGEADLDGDGWVDADELYRYVYRKVVAETPWQRPTRSGQVTGDLRVARGKAGPRTGEQSPPPPAAARRRRPAAYLAVAVLLAVNGWFGYQAVTGAEEGPTCPSDSLRLVVGPAFGPVLRDLAGRYRRDCPAADITVVHIDDGDGPRRMAEEGDGSAWVSDDSAGDLVATPLAVVLYSVVVHEDVGVSSLTPEQLRGIYDGTHRNWTALGGRDVPIRLVSRAASSPLRARLEKQLGVTSPPSTSDDCESPDGAPDQAVACERVNTQDVLGTINQTPGSIGYATASHAVGYRHVNRLKIDGREPAFELVRNGTYPLWSVLRLHTRGTPPEGTLTAHLGRFLGGEAARGILLEHDYLPCTGESRPELCGN
ncbi:caspase, EACC1-associated type [Saccharothrix syringae]|uniref:Uncharacterized protein n=1 Tax=Saccharothrix syringae TaxID=103733 RepID=A0A5Q0GXH4_SACSY|nr:caspase family protein [Saccharothrix syringae]QFZ18180.1 hypothetical protein EKG83_12415 [Saccharothrix syringae]